MKRLVMDVDTGLDDMVAELIAFGSKEVQVDGIVATYGNKLIGHTLPNTLNVVRYLGRDVPVYEGSHRPLKREPVVGGNIHGADGMACFPFPHYQDNTSKGDGIAFLKQHVLEHPGQITVVATGPLTDIARVMQEEPAWKDSVGELVVMGGSLAGGNVTPYAEFNSFDDPEAADYVFRSGVRTILMPLDVTTQVTLGRQELDKLKTFGGKAAKLFGHCMETYYQSCTSVVRECPAMHDPCCIAYLLDPLMFSGSWKSLCCVTDRKSERYGETVDTGKEGNTLVMMHADQSRFWPLVEQAVRNLA